MLDSIDGCDIFLPERPNANPVYATRDYAGLDPKIYSYRQVQERDVFDGYLLYHLNKAHNVVPIDAEAKAFFEPYVFHALPDARFDKLATLVATLQTKVDLDNEGNGLAVMEVSDEATFQLLIKQSPHMADLFVDYMDDKKDHVAVLRPRDVQWFPNMMAWRQLGQVLLGAGEAIMNHPSWTDDVVILREYVPAGIKDDQLHMKQKPARTCVPIIQLKQFEDQVLCMRVTSYFPDEETMSADLRQVERLKALHQQLRFQLDALENRFTSQRSPQSFMALRQDNRQNFMIIPAILKPPALISQQVVPYSLPLLQVMSNRLKMASSSYAGELDMDALRKFAKSVTQKPEKQEFEVSLSPPSKDGRLLAMKSRLQAKLAGDRPKSKPSGNKPTVSEADAQKNMEELFRDERKNKPRKKKNKKKTKPSKSNRGNSIATTQTSSSRDTSPSPPSQKGVSPPRNRPAPKFFPQRHFRPSRSNPRKTHASRFPADVHPLCKQTSPPPQAPAPTQAVAAAACIPIPSPPPPPPPAPPAAPAPTKALTPLPAQAPAPATPPPLPPSVPRPVVPAPQMQLLPPLLPMPMPQMMPAVIPTFGGAYVFHPDIPFPLQQPRPVLRQLIRGSDGRYSASCRQCNGYYTVFAPCGHGSRISDILYEDGFVSATCHTCNQRFTVNPYCGDPRC